MRQVLVVIFLLSNVNLFSQTITFEKSYDTLASYYGNCVKQTIDSGYIFTGGRFASTANQDVLITKTDKFGNIQWVRTYGGPNTEGGVSIEFLSDTNYLIVALLDNGIPNSTSIWLLFLNSNGDTTQSKIIKMGLGANRVFASVATKDSGFAFTGYTTSFPGAINNAFILKVNHYGDTLWSKKFNVYNQDEGWGITQTSDRGFVITGAKVDSGQIPDIFVTRTDSLGNLLWSHSYGYPNVDKGHSIAQTYDKGFLIAGYSWDTSGNNYDGYLLKIDSLGSQQWDKRLGDNRENGFYCMDLLPTGELLLAGITSTQTIYDVWVLKTTATGDTIWSKTFGGASNETPYFIQQTFDNGVIVVGTSNSFIPNSVYLIKTDSLGTLNTNIEDISSISFSIFPNPSCDVVIFEFPISISKPFEYSIFDINGKKVMSNSEIHDKAFINVEYLTSGIYFISLRINNSFLTKKLIVQH